MARRTSKVPTAPRSVVSIGEKWRLELSEAAALCGISENYLRELEKAGEFPPRVRVRVGIDDEGGKMQFVASEVRAWADGLDWRAMVAARQEVARA